MRLDKVYHFLFASFLLLVSAIDIQAQGELDALLDLNMADLMNVEVVTASKTLQRLDEVPATVRIISSEDIRERGYFTLEEALSDLPGFNFRNINGFNSYVFQRGIANQNNLTLLLVDGIQINELNSGGFYGGSQYDLDNIKQIEVVYGPASSLYGTNAVSGIINIITKNAKEEPGLHVSGLYGSFKTYNANVRYGYYSEEDDFGIKVSGMVKSSEKADLGGEDGDNNWSENMENFEDDYSLNLKMNYKDFSFGATYQNKRASRTTNYKSTGTDYLDSGTLWNISFFNAYLKNQLLLSDNLNLNSQLYYRNASVLDNTIGFITETNQAGYYRPNDLLGLESMLSYKPISNLHLIGGIVFEYENLAESFSRTNSENKNIEPQTPEEPDYLHNNLLSAYLQSEITFLDDFTLTAGARFDHSSYYDDVITPRLGIVYHKDNFATKVLYTEAFRAPRPWDFTSGIGNPDLEPEKTKSFEIDASYMFGENLFTNISLYKNTLDQLFSQETVGDNWHWINKGNVKVDGAEIEIKYSNDQMKCYLNYTYNYPYDENKNILHEISRHNINLGFSYSFNKRYIVSIRSNYLGERKNPKIISSTGNDIIEGAFLLHATLSVLNIAGFNLAVSVKNIFDTEYYHSSNRPPDRYRQPQRTIMLKVEYRLF